MPLFIISLLCMITLPSPSRNMLGSNGNIRLPCLISDFNEKVSMLSLSFERATLNLVK